MIGMNNSRLSINSYRSSYISGMIRISFFHTTEKLPRLSVTAIPSHRERKARPTAHRSKALLPGTCQSRSRTPRNFSFQNYFKKFAVTKIIRTLLCVNLFEPFPATYSGKQTCTCRCASKRSESKPGPDGRFGFLLGARFKFYMN